MRLGVHLPLADFGGGLPTALETLTRAWANIGSFEPGSNMVAWLYTILRNEFYSEFRKLRREVADTDGQYAARLATRASAASSASPFRRP